MIVHDPARRPGARRPRGVVVPALLLAVLAAGCAAPDVTLEERDVPEATADTCRDVLRDLPDTLAGEERRPVEPAGALGAAWGDPALVLECGTSMPPSFDDFSQCSLTDGVQWYVPQDDALEDPTADITIWSLGYEPVVSVLVPSAYRTKSDLVMGDLADVVTDDLELVKPCV